MGALFVLMIFSLGKVIEVLKITGQRLGFQDQGVGAEAREVQEGLGRRTVKGVDVTVDPNGVGPMQIEGLVLFLSPLA